MLRKKLAHMLCDLIMSDWLAVIEKGETTISLIVGIVAKIFRHFLSWKAFIQLHFVAHGKRGRNRCANTKKESMRHQFKPSLLPLLCTAIPAWGGCNCQIVGVRIIRPFPFRHQKGVRGGGSYLTFPHVLLLYLHISIITVSFHNLTRFAKITETKSHTETSYQLPLHVLIPWWADEDGVLHEADKAPEGVAFILDLSEQGGHQVRHALAVAHVWIKDCIVEQNPPGTRTATDILVPR